jgi:hypothetical protein
VVLANLKFHAAVGVGFRLTLKKEGEVDLLKWAEITGDSASDEGITDGVAIWDVRTPKSPMFYGYGDEGPSGLDFYLDAAGHTVVDSRAKGNGTSVEETIQMNHMPAGTYDIVYWVASNASHVENRYRLHAPKGTKLVRRSVSTRTFRLVQREFSGTASVHGGRYDASAVVEESAHVAIRKAFFGAFQIPPYPLIPVAQGSYSGPTGTHPVQNDTMFTGAPAGDYTFTVDAGADGEPLVAGVDIAAP